MSSVKAYSDLEPLLERHSLATLCKPFIEGCCKLAEDCPLKNTHIICLVEPDTPPETHHTKTTANFLSHGPRREPSEIDKHFDDDGPGTLSIYKEARHDNDHILIQNIKILPTTDEILAIRRPFMPVRSDYRPHRLPKGPSGHLDTLFRQQRYNEIEPVIDVCYHAMQQLVFAKNNAALLSDYQYRMDTPNRNRYCLFRGVEFEELMFHDRKGALVRVSYDCPTSLERRRVHKSGVLESGMLCAVIGSHDETNELTTTFFEIHLSETTETMKAKIGNHSRASVQLAFADKGDVAGIRRCAYYVQGLLQGTFVLVDMPKTLLASFVHCLKRLQKLADVPNFAFSRQIAPSGPLDDVTFLPPTYASVPDYEFDLTDLRSQKRDRSPLKLRPRRPETTEEEIYTTLELLKAQTTLDQGQVIALYESLSQGLAMTIGPPGTGKSYLGVALAQVILSSQGKSDWKPIVIATQTNRACDEFLHDLVEKGITKIVRIGGGSKADWTKAFMLSEVRNKNRATMLENAKKRETRIAADNLTREGAGFADSLNMDYAGWHLLKDHLRTRLPEIYEGFTRLEKYDGDVNDLRQLRNFSGFAYEFWKDGGDITNIDALLKTLDTILGPCELRHSSNATASQKLKDKIFASIKRNTRIASSSSGSSGSSEYDGSGDDDSGSDGSGSLHRQGLGKDKAKDIWIHDLSPMQGGLFKDIWSLNISQRQKLVSEWVQEVDSRKVCDAFAELHRRHQDAIQRKKIAEVDHDARYLAEQQVIGLTTTGVVQNWEMLNKLGPRVVIFEEASLLLESHTLCSLFPSIEHAILIGDPLQLRPQVAIPALSADNSMNYCLDVSLFERLMYFGFQVSKLTVQRRMHPDIADLLRAGDYSYLVDAEKTKTHPAILGITERSYWLDHHQPESSPNSKSGLASSYQNCFEVEFCRALVRYLIELQGYTMGDITIMTPYNGQLALLHSQLREMCPVRLTEEDRMKLIDEGFLSEDELFAKSATTSVELSSMLRIMTVDTMQGAESNIIIFSAVRSNNLNSVGFLSIRNRINVACSRARNGFYILGNATLMSSVEHWGRIIDEFKVKKRIGSALPIQCCRHPAHCHEIFEPGQFAQISACQAPCGASLPCGHQCPEICHSLDMHSDGRIKCSQDCQQTLSCGHPCRRKCGEPCGGCIVVLGAMRLPCGHLLAPLCSETTRGVVPNCKEPSEIRSLPCGHTVEILCYQRNQVLECKAKCDYVFPKCGHPCTNDCRICLQEHADVSCQQLCGKTLLECSHTCATRCHPGVDCPPCNRPCPKSCQHGSCDLPCSLPCEPCTLPCGLGRCAHREPCSMICSLPCNRLPCDEPCTMLLSCEFHLCPGLCSETCMTACSQCDGGKFAPHKLIQLTCGHCIAVEELDRAFKLGNLYRITNGVIETGKVIEVPSSSEPIRCPECCQPVEKVGRYEFGYQLQKLPSTIERVIAKMGRRLSEVTASLFRTELHLRQTKKSFQSGLKSGPLGGKHNHRRVRERLNILLNLQQETSQFRNTMVVPFEDGIHRLCLFIDNAEVLGYVAPTFTFRFDVFHYLCRLVSLEDAYRVFQLLCGLDLTDQHTSILINGLTDQITRHIATDMSSLETRIADCKALHLIRVEVELRLIQLGMHRILKDLGTESGLDAAGSLAIVKELCRRYPSSAGKVIDTHDGIKAQILYSRLGTYTGMGILEFANKGSKELVVKLGTFGIGDLRYCTNRHPYSGKDFSDCPECGRKGPMFPISGSMPLRKR